MIRTPRQRRRRAGFSPGFTLVEILVVIGIIVILAGILVPMVTRAMRQAKQTRTAADLQTIASALEAFKGDHGDYPRTDVGLYNLGAAYLGRFLAGPLGDGLNPPIPPGTNDMTDPETYDGAKEYLAGDAVQSGGNRYVALIPNSGVAVTTTSTWAACNSLNDGADGPGIRMRAGGKKYGPYVTADKFPMRGVAFVDGNGSPILYFPASQAQINVTATAGAYVNRSSTVAAGNKALMKYDADDNFEAFRRTGEADATAEASPFHRIRALLGDYNGNGVIDTAAGEKVVTEAPYLLIAAGTDGKFGPEQGFAAPANTMTAADVDRCDDVANFR